MLETCFDADVVFVFGSCGTGLARWGLSWEKNRFADFVNGWEVRLTYVGSLDCRLGRQALSACNSISRDKDRWFASIDTYLDRTTD